MRSPSSRTQPEPSPPPEASVRIDTVLVLADARGKELGSLAQGRPPCLVSLHGRSVLDWQLAAIRAAGARRIVVVRGYRGEMITPGDVEFVQNDLFAVSGALSSLLCARKWFGGGFAVASGNLLFEPSLLRATLECEEDLSCVIDHDWQNYYRQRFDDPERHLVRLEVQAGRVVELGGESPAGEAAQGQPIGLYGVRGAGVRALLELVEGARTDRLGRMSILDGVRALLARGLRPRAIPASGGWLSLQSERDHGIAAGLSRPLNERLLIGR